MILLVMNALISYALTGKQAGGSLALQNVWTSKHPTRYFLENGLMSHLLIESSLT